MTFRDLVKRDYPNDLGDYFYGGVISCPHRYGYCDINDCLCYKENKVNRETDEMCRHCWDREVPVNSDLNENKENEKSETPVNNDEPKLPNKLNFSEGIVNYFGTIIEFSMKDIKIEQSVGELSNIEIKGFIRKINDNDLINNKGEFR